MDYVELHARSAYSFLRGGSLPESLVEAANHGSMPALALSDRQGFYGSIRFNTAAKETRLRALVGCEVVMDDDTVIPLLVATQAGYRRLCRLLTAAHLRSPKGEGRISWAELSEENEGLIALTGDEGEPLKREWILRGAPAAAAAGEKLLGCFGKDRLYAELQRHLVQGEDHANEFVLDWARAKGVPLLATNGVDYAVPSHCDVADVFTCLREHVTLDKAGRRLSRNRERYLKTGTEMKELFPDLPEAIANTVRLADRLEFTMANLDYRFPDYPVRPGETQEGFLHQMTYFGAQQRYGSITGPVRRQLDKELELITRLGFSGYFLIVWDLLHIRKRTRNPRPRAWKRSQ